MLTICNIANFHINICKFSYVHIIVNFWGPTKNVGPLGSVVSLMFIGYKHDITQTNEQIHGLIFWNHLYYLQGRLVEGTAIFLQQDLGKLGRIQPLFIQGFLRVVFFLAESKTCFRAFLRIGGNKWFFVENQKSINNLYIYIFVVNTLGMITMQTVLMKEIIMFSYSRPVTGY